jgi:homocysteine S-methyltransferase
LTKLFAKLAERIARGDVIVLDGAMGTELERRGVPMDRVAWSAAALATHPEVIRAVHEDNIRAGADIIITNSFGASRHVLTPAGLGRSVADLNRRSVELAIEARERAGGGRDIAIAGSISSWVAEGDRAHPPPANQSLANYREQAEVLAEAGADLLALEMLMDIEQSQLMIEAARSVDLPVSLGFTCEFAADGATVMLLGNRAESLAEALDALAPLGGDIVAVMHSVPEVTDAALDLVFDRWAGPIAAYPHSGGWKSPNWQFVDIMEPAALAAHGRRWVGRGVQIMGGCCGLGPDHIRALAGEVRGAHVMPRPLAGQSN